MFRVMLFAATATVPCVVAVTMWPKAPTKPPVLTEAAIIRFEKCIKTIDPTAVAAGDATGLTISAPNGMSVLMNEDGNIYHVAGIDAAAVDKCAFPNAFKVDEALMPVVTPTVREQGEPSQPLIAERPAVRFSARADADQLDAVVADEPAPERPADDTDTTEQPLFDLH